MGIQARLFESQSSLPTLTPRVFQVDPGRTHWQGRTSRVCLAVAPASRFGRLRVNLSPLACPDTQFPKEGPAITLIGLSKIIVRSQIPAALVACALSLRRSQEVGRRAVSVRGRWGCNELKTCDSYRGTSSSIRAFSPEDFWAGLRWEW